MLGVQKAENCNVDVRRKDLPEKLCPFEQDVSNIECVQHPGPLAIAKSKISLEPSRLCIAYVAAVQI